MKKKIWGPVNSFLISSTKFVTIPFNNRKFVQSYDKEAPVVHIAHKVDWFFLCSQKLYILRTKLSECFLCSQQCPTSSDNNKERNSAQRFVNFKKKIYLSIWTNALYILDNKLNLIIFAASSSRLFQISKKKLCSKIFLFEKEFFCQFGQVY